MAPTPAPSSPRKQPPVGRIKAKTVASPASASASGSSASASKKKKTVASKDKQPQKRIKKRAIPQKKVRSVSSKAQQRWKPIGETGRRQVIGTLTGLFPLVIDPVRREDRKRIVQEHLRNVVARIGAALTDVQVPVSAASKISDAAHLAAANKQLEERLMVELAQQTALEKRLELEEQELVKDEEDLDAFRKAKHASDVRNNALHRRLHPLLRPHSSTNGSGYVGNHSDNDDDTDFDKEEAALQRQLAPESVPKVYDVKDDTRLQRVLHSITGRLFAIEASTSLPAETAAQLGDLNDAAKLFLRSLQKESAVVDSL